MNSCCLLAISGSSFAVTENPARCSEKETADGGKGEGVEQGE